MWLFKSPKNYSEYYKKIAWTSFIIALIGLILFTPLTIRFELFMNKISFGIHFKAGFFAFYLADIYLPVLLLLSELIFKLHKKLSDLLGIGFQFEKNYVIGRFLKKLKMYPKLKNFTKKNRKEVVNQVYYKYTDPEEPVIDKALVVKSLGSWSWFWIVVDIFVAMTVVGLAILFVRYTFLKLLIILGGLLLVYILAYIIYIFPCKSYATKMVDTILRGDRYKDIARYQTITLVTIKGKKKKR